MKKIASFSGLFLLLFTAFFASSCEQVTSLIGNTASVTTVATPTFSPAAGTYTIAQTVTISSTTSGATIYYTTDGTTPSATNGTTYTSAVTVSSSLTLNAIAVKSGMTSSGVASSAYVISSSSSSVSAPTFSPAAGTYSSSQTVTLSTTTSGASIYYTTDGRDPTSASTLYSAPILVNASTTVKAIAIASGVSSSISSAAYVISTAGAAVTVTNPYNPTFAFTGVPTSTVAVGTAVAVSATVTPAADSYQWYVDGVVVTGSTSLSATLGASLAAGSHVVTLVATKGTVLASDSFSYTVGSSATGTITGVVSTINSSGTSSVLSGVTVTLLSGSTTLTTATTDSAGAFTLTQASATGLTLTFSKSGYITTTYSDVAITTGSTTTLAPVLNILSTYTGTGTVTGTISNAFTGAGVASATIKAFAGVNASTSGTALATATTTSSGTYTLTGLTSGQYTAQVSLSGFTTTTFSFYVLGGTTVSNQNTAITPTVSSGQVRVVLTWGATPYDLDSHLKVPSGTSYNHVYYGDAGSSTASPYAALDHDDTSSYGPETITIYTLASSGTYTYYVHDYSNKYSTTSTGLASSGATVKVYSGATLMATYYVPSGIGTLWKVFTLSGSTLTPVNQLFNESYSSSVTSHSVLAQDDRDFFRNLPRK